MTKLVKIGSCYGVKIPKTFIEKAHLKDAIINLKLEKNGILICPNKSPRSTWDSPTLRKKAAQMQNLKDLNVLEEDFLDEDMQDWKW